MLVNDHLFETRYVRAAIPIRIAIFDRQDAIIGLSNAPDGWVNNLWSNSEIFLEMLLSYYDQLWSSAFTSSINEAASKKKQRKEKPDIAQI